MHGPVWLNAACAGLMAGTALCHAGRLVAARPPGHRGGGAAVATRAFSRYGIDATHLVTSCVMAAMLVVTFGGRLATAAAVVLGVPTLWFVQRAFREETEGGDDALLRPSFRAPGQQAVMGITMVFMLAVAGRSAEAVSAGSGSTGNGTMMDGMAMPGVVIGGHPGLSTFGAFGTGGTLGTVGPASPVALISVVLVGVLCVVAARHALQLSVAVAGEGGHRAQGARATRGSRPAYSAVGLRARAGELLLTPEVSLGCQLAMSATMIYMLVLLV
jgi:hypothetical protein